MKIRDRIFKSILILGCSIIIVCSIPFPSHAAAVGSIPYDFNTFYPVFRTLLLLGGLTSDDPVRTGEYDPSTLGELDPAEFLSDFLDDAGTYQQGLNLKVIAWCAHAIQYGRFLIPEDEFQNFKSFLVSKFGSQVGSSSGIGTLLQVYPTFAAGSTSTVTVYGHTSNGETYTAASATFSGSDSEYAFFGLFPPAVERAFKFYIVFKNPSNSYPNIERTLPEGWRASVTNWSMPDSNNNNVSYRFLEVDCGGLYIDSITVTNGRFIPYAPTSSTAMGDLVKRWRSIGILSESSPISATIAAGVDALSAIGNKVLSNTTNIDSSTGELTGVLSVALPNFSALNEILDSVRAQNLSFAQALQLLNVKAASSSATTQELTDILEVVKASTLPISDALTSGYAKQAELATIAGSITDTLTQEAIEKIRMGYDPDQESPPYWPMWFNWIPPDLNFDDPTADSSGIIPQVVNAFGVTSGLITGLLSESGAFSYLFYIGVLFVLFSVVVGMYHFIGNLNSRPSGSPSVKAKIEGKSVTVPKGKKGS